MVELLEDKGIKYGEKNVWVEVQGKVRVIITDEHTKAVHVQSWTQTQVQQ